MTAKPVYILLLSDNSPVLLEWIIQQLFSPHRSVLEPLAQWDSPMQVKLSCWKSGLNTLLVELLPWALLANYSQWDLWLFEGETIVLQIPAGKVIVPPNFKVGCHYGKNRLQIPVMELDLSWQWDHWRMWNIHMVIMHDKACIWSQ